MNIEGLFNERDFADMMFPIMSKKIKDIPALKEFKLEDSSLNIQQVMRYIALTYDRGSPILKKFPLNDPKRKIWAARYAGWEPQEEGLFDDEVDDMLKCKNQEVNALIIEYVKLYDDPEWSLIVTGYEAYYQKLAAILNVGTSKSTKEAADVEKIKGTLFDQAKKMAKDLSDASIKILQDENIYLKRDFYCAIDSEARNRLKITPERIAGVER